MKDLEIKLAIRDEDEAEAMLPVRGSLNAAGYDVSAFHPAAGGTFDIHPGKVAFVNTGVYVNMMGTGLMMDIHGRSGLSSKQGIVLANCVGILDPDYHGEVIVALRNVSDKTFYVNDGERIAQLVFRPLVEVGFTQVKEFTTDTDRGEGGFGSTGTK